MRIITQRQEDFCRQIEPGFSRVAGSSRILVNPYFCHDGKVIAVSNGGGKTLHFQMVDLHCITHIDIRVIYNGSIIVTLHTQQNILS